MYNLHAQKDDRAMEKEPKDRICVALNSFERSSEAVATVARLCHHVGWFSLGPLFQGASAFGPIHTEIRQAISDSGARLFCDTNYYGALADMSLAALAQVKNRANMFSVACQGGGEMMKSAAETVVMQADGLGVPRPLVVGVTLLPHIISLGYVDISDISRPYCIRIMAQYTQYAGLDGAVAYFPEEIANIRETCGEGFLIVAAGVTSDEEYNHNNPRHISTVSDAIIAGADIVIVDDCVTRHPHDSDRLTAVQVITEQIGLALA